jgi:hypothetical protein
MLDVTNPAKTELLGVLRRVVAQEGASIPEDEPVGLRLVASDDPKDPQLGLALDSPREGDEVVDHEGSSVLIVDARTAQRLADRTLDVIETPDGLRLGLRE